MRHLVLILGDQLDSDSAAFDGFDAKQDSVWMAEVVHESTKVWSAKPRIVMFLAAMRHFRDALRERGWRVCYRELTADGAVWREADGRAKPAQGAAFSDALRESLASLKPQRVVLVEPGEWSVREEIRATMEAAELPLEMREDRHFLCSHRKFAAHAEGRKQLRMEYFYREMRERHGVPMDGGKPTGGDWKFDSENRKSFGKDGPPMHKTPRSFPPNEITRGVIAMVNTRFDWPVTPAEAGLALKDFIAHRLARIRARSVLAVHARLCGHECARCRPAAAEFLLGLPAPARADVAQKSAHGGAGA